jgi:hypothetical protein
MSGSIAKVKGPRILQGKKVREKTMSRIKALKSWREQSFARGPSNGGGLCFFFFFLFHVADRVRGFVEKVGVCLGLILVLVSRGGIAAEPGDGFGLKGIDLEGDEMLGRERRLSSLVVVSIST